MTAPAVFGLDLASVRTKLVGLGYFLSVTDVLAATEALDESLPASPPAAFIGVATETAGPNRVMGSGKLSQRVDVVLSVLFAESASRFDRAAEDQVDATKRKVVGALLGWKPTGVERQLNYRGFRVVSVGGGLAWGEVLFGSTFLLTA